MDVKSLMVGDWVQNPLGWKARVMSIKHTCVIKDEWEYLFKIGISKDTFQNYLSESELFPIPLTPEILEKNGFKRDPLWHHCDKDFGDYTIYVQLGYANKIEYIKIAEKGVDNVIPSERTKMYLTHIKYVHELQRVLRLCGIEKEIEL